MSFVHAASATELSKLAVSLNSRLVCVSGLIIAIPLSVSSAVQLVLLVLPPQERACFSAVIEV